MNWAWQYWLLTNQVNYSRFLQIKIWLLETTLNCAEDYSNNLPVSVFILCDCLKLSQLNILMLRFICVTSSAGSATLGDTSWAKLTIQLGASKTKKKTIRGWNLPYFQLLLESTTQPSLAKARNKTEVESVQLGNTNIADMDKCPQDKCCLDKWCGDSCNLLYMFPGPYV